MNAPNMQAVLIRAIVLLVMCLGFSIAIMSHKPAQATLVRAPAAAAAHAVAMAQPPMVVMPTTVLPTISVRPSAAEIAAAMKDDTNAVDNAPKFIKAAQERQLFDTTVSLRSLRLDMPYYSFGKVLPGVSKE
jgi:hypothetical protein